MDLKGKTIILTGAKRIGKTVALTLAEKNVNLVFSYLDSSENFELLCKEVIALGSKAIAFKADLSRKEDIDNLVVNAVNHFGKVDVLIHMAANYPKTPLGQITLDNIHENIDIIAASSLLLGQRLGLEMKKSDQGKIIFFSDWSVLKNPYKDHIVYNAAKAAVESITKSLAKELAPNVLVNAIAPGPILPPEGLTDEENDEVIKHTLLSRWGGAEEIAKAVLYLLDSDFVTGTILLVDGGRSIT